MSDSVSDLSKGNVQLKHLLGSEKDIIPTQLQASQPAKH